jgi:hypothetical protein
VRRSLRGTAWGVRAALLVTVALSIGVPVAHASPSSDRAVVFVFTVADATLTDLLTEPGFSGLAQHGGAALLIMTSAGQPMHDLTESQGDGKGNLPFWQGGDFGSSALSAAADRVATTLDRSISRDALVFIASSGPATSNDVSGGRLGAIVMAEGRPADLAEAMSASSEAVGSSASLTSDSTRRDGVVTSRDLARTMITFAQMPVLAVDPGGEEIRIVDVPPPLDLYDRYVESKRLAVPIGTAAALFAVLSSALGIVALLWRISPRWLRGGSAWTAMSAPFLALSLLLVGHLPSLTYATVIPFVVATTAVGTLALVPVARRRGTLAAIAVAGVILLVALAVEAALGWTAALTPLLGGSQLDGGRFFGLPNAFIGLLLGGSVYVAQRLPRLHGTALMVGVGLFAGSPWTGSNIGAAVTLFAGAGIWWGLRGGLAWWRTFIAAVASVLAGTALVVIAHRYLTSAETHVTRFAEHTGGLHGIWDKLVDRLGVGTQLIASNPFAILPVLGVILTLIVVLRPPAPVRTTFDEAPVWRLALLAILLGSVVAYLANDSGPSAIGEGFTTSLAAMLYVSLLRRNDIMESS